MRTPAAWLRHIKRRQAGVYLVRTRKHASGRRENGYVGRSTHVPIRIRQHLGLDRRHKPQPWSDLDPVWHTLWLPWWLSWKWVQAPLEWLAIKVLLPRYNIQMNKRNPRRITPWQATQQRLQRDAGIEVRPASHRTFTGALAFSMALLCLFAAAVIAVNR